MVKKQVVVQIASNQILFIQPMGQEPLFKLLELKLQEKGVYGRGERIWCG